MMGRSKGDIWNAYATADDLRRQHARGGPIGRSGRAAPGLRRPLRRRGSASKSPTSCRCPIIPMVCSEIVANLPSPPLDVHGIARKPAGLAGRAGRLAASVGQSRRRRTGASATRFRLHDVLRGPDSPRSRSGKAIRPRRQTDAGCSSPGAARPVAESTSGKRARRPAGSRWASRATFSSGPPASRFPPCFWRTAEGTVLIGAAEQLIGLAALSAGPFGYCGSIGPIGLSETARRQIAETGRRDRARNLACGAVRHRFPAGRRESPGQPK